MHVAGGGAPTPIRQCEQCGQPTQLKVFMSEVKLRVRLPGFVANLVGLAVLKYQTWFSKARPLCLACLEKRGQLGTMSPGLSKVLKAVELGDTKL